MVQGLVRVTCAALMSWWTVGMWQPTPVQASGPADPNAGQVAVGGVEVIRLRTPAAGMTVRQRADAVQDRLVTILAEPKLTGADIVAAPAGNAEWRILVKAKLLVTVSKADATANGTTPRKLAQTWAARIRNVLPTLNVKPNPNNGEPRAG